MLALISLYCLQAFRNAAARLLTGKKRREHITPTLAYLDWFPLHFSIQFKILLLGFKSQGFGATLLKPCNPTRALRSTNQLLSDILRSRLKSRSNRGFSVAAPNIWNNLPLYIRAAQTLNHFKTLFKTYIITVMRAKDFLRNIWKISYWVSSWFSGLIVLFLHFIFDLILLFVWCMYLAGLPPVKQIAFNTATWQRNNPSGPSTHSHVVLGAI